MTDMNLSGSARRGALAIAAVAAVTLAVRLWLRVEVSDGLVDALSYMSQYFTILTNTLTMLMMAWLGAGKTLPPRIIKAVVIAIVCVGLVYHTMLAHLVDLSGLELWADHGTHTFVPLLTGLWWVFFGPRPPLRLSDIPLWVAWPLVYCGYILVRAEFSGFYPYPFLNVPEIGWTGLAASVAGLVVGFVVVGLLLTALARIVRRDG